MTLPSDLAAIRARCHGKDFHRGERGISVISCIYCTDLPRLLARLEEMREKMEKISEICKRDLRGREPFSKARKDIIAILDTALRPLGELT